MADPTVECLLRELLSALTDYYDAIDGDGVLLLESGDKAILEQVGFIILEF